MPKNKNKTNTGGKKGKNKPKQGKVGVLKGSGAYSLKDMASAAKSAVQSALKNKQTRTMLINGAGSIADRFVPGSKNTAQGLAKFLLNKVSGSGDYAVGGMPNSNSLFKQKPSGEMAQGNALSIPKMHTSGNSIRVSHREYVMDIVAPDNGQEFNPLVFAVNPGDPTIFPWLSNLAQLFEQYKFHGLVFEFVSTSSPYNQSPSMGYVMFAAQYNVLQAPFQSPIELENSTDSIMARPDHCLMYGVECATQSFNYYYVRNNRNVVIDPATYEFVNITLATKGLPSSYTPGSVLGQLWISFDIELVQPIYELPAGGSVLLAGNPVNNVTIGNFLAPFDASLGSGRSSLNFNGRFTPTSLNGSGKPLFSTFKTVDGGGTTQTNLVVELANLESGNGVLVQLTLTGNARPPASTANVSVTSGVGQFGTPVSIQTTPSIQITNLVNCALATYDPYSTIIPVNLNQENTRVSILAASATTVLARADTFASNGKVSYTYTFYVQVSGSNPAFVISPGTAYVGGTLTSTNIMLIEGPSYTAQLNMTLIKNTTSSGAPTYIPYAVPQGVLPTGAKPNYSNSMVMNRTQSEKQMYEELERDDERLLLRQLAERHGLHLMDRRNSLQPLDQPSHLFVSEPKTIENCQESDEEDYQALKPNIEGDPPAPTPLQRVRSLSFSSRF